MPKLLVTQRVAIDRHGQKKDCLEASYTRYFESLGVCLIPVSNFLNDIEGFLEGLGFEGLVLSGGGDVGLCGKTGAGGLDVSEERDALCTGLVERTLKLGLPVLGICYGMQLLNCRFGGGIDHGIHRGEKVKRKPGINHGIRMERPLFGLSGPYEVNHYHDHGLRAESVSPAFEVFAVDSESGTVEGIIHRELPVMGIQWHPERGSPDPEFNRRLVGGFLRIIKTDGR